MGNATPPLQISDCNTLRLLLLAGTNFSILVVCCILADTNFSVFTRALGGRINMSSNFFCN